MSDSSARRADLSAEELERMKQMDSQGIPRKQIAEALGLKHSSCVTRRLGAKRAYAKRDVEMPEPDDSAEQV